MARFDNAELYYARVVPDRPNKKFNRENPTWEVQIRTSDPKQRKAWEAQGLKLKAVVPDDGKPYWKTTLKKKIFKKDGTDSSPIEVVGGNKRPIDPATIGNGSIGNVRVFQYDYDNNGKSGVANILSAIQVTTLKVYTPKQYEDDFEEQDMEVIDEVDDEEEESEDPDTSEDVEEDEEEEDSSEEEEVEDVEDDEEEKEEKPTPKKKSPSMKKKKFD